MPKQVNKKGRKEVQTVVTCPTQIHMNITREAPDMAMHHYTLTSPKYLLTDRTGVCIA